MRLVIDIETDRLVNPSKIWCIVCKDIDTGVYYAFKEPTKDNKETLSSLIHSASLIIGHYITSFDLPVIHDLLDISVPLDKVVDTLVVSKLYDYSRQGGHSIRQYGLEFGLEKIDFTDFSHWSQEMETYCQRDVDVSEKIYLKYEKYIQTYIRPILMEQEFQYKVVNKLSENGFAFNEKKAKEYLDKVTTEL